MRYRQTEKVRINAVIKSAQKQPSIDHTLTEDIFAENANVTN